MMFELLMKLKEIRDKIDETSCEIRTGDIDKARRGKNERKKYHGWLG